LPLSGGIFAHSSSIIGGFKVFVSKWDFKTLILFAVFVLSASASAGEIPPRQAIGKVIDFKSDSVYVNGQKVSSKNVEIFLNDRIEVRNPAGTIRIEMYHLPKDQPFYTLGKADLVLDEGVVQLYPSPVDTHPVTRFLDRAQKMIKPYAEELHNSMPGNDPVCNAEDNRCHSATVGIRG
jgi:hypothetical protein